MKKVLVTSTSLKDTAGSHHELLGRQGWDVTFARGPFSETEILGLVGEFHAIICGDDVYSKRVLEACLPNLACLSKYGIGLDKIDLEEATKLKIPVLYTPGVNHVTVAEHVFGLLLMMYKNLYFLINETKAGRWTRITGSEVFGKRLAVLGVGRIGREVIKRAQAFGMQVVGYDPYLLLKDANLLGIEKTDSVVDLLTGADVLIIQCSLTEESRGAISFSEIKKMNSNSLVINCARGEIVDNDAILEALNEKHLTGYACDVLDQEPPPANHPIMLHPNCLVTPHVGSRTSESVVRQATMAIQNVIAVFSGADPLAQRNIIS